MQKLQKAIHKVTPVKVLFLYLFYGYLAHSLFLQPWTQKLIQQVATQRHNKLDSVLHLIFLKTMFQSKTSEKVLCW